MLNLDVVTVIVISLFIEGLATNTSTTMSTAICVDRSVHSANVEEVHEVPMSVIHRPIPPVLDDDKVKSLMETLEV